ncbi:MAG: azurin [Verrucomicrobia bacterium]|nr:azurin [Verrucomicrobiota bacterium]
MKLRLLLASALIAMFTAGCGQKESTAPAQAAVAGPRTLELTAGDNMKFNVTTLEVKAGEQVTIVLTNIGTQPKEVMGHNWILLKIGTDLEAFVKTAALAKDNEYFPESLSDQVIAHIPLLGPRKSGEVTFTAPTTPGSYPFLCSFPAHFQVGMKGVLVVK